MSLRIAVWDRARIIDAPRRLDLPQVGEHVARVEEAIGALCEPRDDALPLLEHLTGRTLVSA